MRIFVDQRQDKIIGIMMHLPPCPNFAQPIGKKKGGSYLGLAKRFLLGEGIIVPVDEAEEAEESSSSWAESIDGLGSSNLSP